MRTDRLARRLGPTVRAREAEMGGGPARSMDDRNRRPHGSQHAPSAYRHSSFRGENEETIFLAWVRYQQKGLVFRKSVTRLRATLTGWLSH